MNIEQAKAIPVSVILDKLGFKPHRKNGNKWQYFSPFRNEKTPSFWVNTKKNEWIDYGDMQWKRGDGIHFVRAHLFYQGEDSQVPDALRWLSKMTGFIPNIRSIVDPEEKETKDTLVWKYTGNISKPYLIEYGANRGIPKTVLDKYFKQTIVLNNSTGFKFHSLSMQNEAKGYELRNERFKGCLGRKDVTFIRGTGDGIDGINIFEGAFDFLSVVTEQEGLPLKNDTVILHSLCNLERATAYIRNHGYKYCLTWMDNDEPGQKATAAWKEFCQTEKGLRHIPMNSRYEPYKDVNAAHMAKLGLDA